MKDIRIDIMLEDVNGYEVHIRNILTARVSPLCRTLTDNPPKWESVKVGEQFPGCICAEIDREYKYAVLVCPGT